MAINNFLVQSFRPREVVPSYKPPVPNAGPGTLYVRDTFVPSQEQSGSDAHGFLVIGAAVEQAGEQSQVLGTMLDPPRVASRSVLNPEMQRLSREEMAPAEARRILLKSSSESVSRFLHDQSDYLERASDSGVRNSAFNFSVGLSKASEAGDLYLKALEAIHQSEPTTGQAGAAAKMHANPETLAGNYARAFGVDLGKLRSQDTEVRNEARAQLQQSIVDGVSDSLDRDRGVEEARLRWSGAVERIERGHNSVVIAAGNEGQHEEALETSVGGRQLHLPSDFESNVLENELVTSVGAVGGPGLGARRSEYSSDSPGVDIYANGDFASRQDLKQGTSFAAPRVARTMAELHSLNPCMSSSQIENLMKNRLTTQGANGSQAIRVLRPDANLDFLRGRKY